MTRILALAIAAVVTLLALPASAAHLKVTSAGAVRGLIAGIIEEYKRQSGDTFDFTVGTTGKMTPGSRADLGRVGIGVVIRDGARVPDVASPEAFKKAVIEARSLAYTDPAQGGTSGIYFAGLADRFGIADEVKRKSVLTTGGREAALEVAQGKAEIGIVFISEAMAVKGVKLAGPLPPALQDYS